MANIITLCRLLFLPFMLLIYELKYFNNIEKSFLLANLFLFLAATDWLDGYIARKYKMQSKFGAFLDPAADKVLVILSLVILLDMQLINYWVALIIILRELIISALREWMAQMGKADKIAVKYVGKLKTFAQMVAIFMLFLTQFIMYYFNNIYKLWILCSNLTINVAVLLTIISLYFYLKETILFLSKK